MRRIDPQGTELSPESMNMQVDLDQPEFWSPSAEDNLCITVPLFLFDFIRHFDAFGKPVSLNFRGRETYKTIPGAIFTVACILLIVRFAEFRKGMYDNLPAEWTIEEHSTLLQGSDMSAFVDMNA
jgi:hypothetical protein